MYIKLFSFIFFFNDTATTEIYTLSLHDALPIFLEKSRISLMIARSASPDRRTISAYSRCSAVSLVSSKSPESTPRWYAGPGDRKSTRLNSSHDQISYAVFYLIKKKFRSNNANKI